MAQLVSSWSKDGSTKCGAVIVDRDNRIISTGYNGLAKGVDDSVERLADRDTKYRMVIHAEENAILFAKQDLHATTIYCTFHPCAKCASLIIQVGIQYVGIPRLDMESELVKRWLPDIMLARDIFKEADITLREVDLQTGLQYAI